MDIRLDNVSYWYNPGRCREDRKPLHSIDMYIPSGQFVAIVGVTGSGKSTLAQLIAGLLLPREGSITIAAYSTSKTKHSRLLRQKIGIVFQYPEHQLFKETVYADIKYGLGDRNVSEMVLAEQIKQTMSMVGLSYERYKDRSPFRLSGGEKRRVALAGALAMKPEVLILDEPTVGLDPLGRQELLRLLQNVRQKKSMTMLFITHELQDALEYTDRIIAMRQGEIIADIMPSQLRDQMDMLGKANLVPTAILRFIRAFESYFPNRIPDELIREDEVIAYVAKHLNSLAPGKRA